MEIKIPTHAGLQLSRELLPQIGKTTDFISNLNSRNIGHRKVQVDPGTLKPSQGEFDHKTVLAIIKNKKPTHSTVVISNDGYVVDGHHRWLADYNTGKKTEALQVNLTAQEIISLTKNLPNTAYKTIKSVVRDSLESRKYK